MDGRGGASAYAELGVWGMDGCGGWMDGVDGVDGLDGIAEAVPQRTRSRFPFVRFLAFTIRNARFFYCVSPTHNTLQIIQTLAKRVRCLITFSKILTTFCKKSLASPIFAYTFALESK